jgi:hypothetical protein
MEIPNESPGARILIGYSQRNWRNGRIFGGESKALWESEKPRDSELEKFGGCQPRDEDRDRTFSHLDKGHKRDDNIASLMPRVSKDQTREIRKLSE